MNFVPYWGAFVYVVKKYLYLKVDTSYDTGETNYILNQDPCLRGQHLFQNGDDGGDLEHYRYELVDSSSGLNGMDNMVVAMEYAFDSLWILVTADQQRIFRIGGTDPSAL